MALRTFTDRDGNLWNAWQVVPNGSSASYPNRYRAGWVCFERVGGGGRCRLPIAEMPAAWDALPDERLDLIRRAADAASQTGSMTRVPENADIDTRA
jgi:hypothetical protein